MEGILLLPGPGPGWQQPSFNEGGLRFPTKFSRSSEQLCSLLDLPSTQEAQHNKFDDQAPPALPAAVNGGVFGPTSPEATRRRLRHAPAGQHAVGPLQQRASAANSDDGRRVVDVCSIRRYHSSLPRMKTKSCPRRERLAAET
ncbi:hypothetical protein P3T76_012543 [Phytophthora citrophthora]|uniref:Uncharacterized protein n=1 Tax=Phytophthora citrophthora TaxID=4793 RepID=A0AAD9G538_9STRA|nr:hypothetical protein P3T76_012543 [Phytophthora citrophthora]